VTTSRFAVRRDRVRLECVDYGGDGPAALLLHGLAGTALEWEGTAAWLTGTHRVVAPDQRGHGGSERRPPSVSAAELVEDVLAILAELGLRRVTLIGQSFGGQTAFLTAARRADLVRALVVAEASPTPATAQSVEELNGWLAEGTWPSFEPDVAVRTLAETIGEDYWSEWEAIRAPTLIVRGECGWINEAEAEAMRSRLSSAHLVTVAGAGHDVHLEAPEKWRRAVQEFLRSIPPE
jgi:pimeloyl-ACP methyl ester carboxylesterase